MNVILADDERLVRSSLRSMLEELNIPIRIVGEARNGEELLKLVKSSSPDLIFVDIRMPKMDGLEAIREGKRFAPDASWVIVTGFSEFKYAQEAIRLGTSNYLLKPAEPEELEKCVRMAIQEQNKTAYYLNCEFEHWLTTQLRKSSSEAIDSRESSYQGYRLTGLTLYLNKTDLKPGSSDLMQKLAQEIQQAIVKQPEFKEVRSGIVSLRSETISCFWAFPVTGSPAHIPLISSIERQALSIVNREPGSSIHVLRTNDCEDVLNLLREMEEIHALAPLRVLFPVSSEVLSIAALRAAAVVGKSNVFEFCEHLVQLINLYHRKDYVSYLKKVATMKKHDMRDLFESRDKLKHVCRFLAKAIHSPVHEGMSAPDWYQALQRQGEDLLTDSNLNSPMDKTDVIQRVIEYVDKHYMEEIGIGTLAGEFNVTPNYLSTLFHKRNGVTFVKYLTNTRMLKAKELLLTKSEFKVQDVAQAVGYFSSRHFTKLFLEHFQCYPSEIRERNG
ncbi:response regulator transcription factor [Cohnella herbarum]|uniref:Response regulator n=1 Tax=Cohnella herbarum TaxID=2728023 RepID=A0A7Z2VQQ3_9BACL|nr:response regulator [Cohnella herbarum]QJD87421.1 response regulator [Cohnella herbarum]